MKRMIVLVAAVLAVSPLKAAPGQERQTPAERVAPFVGEGTLLIIRIDLSAIDVAAWWAKMVEMGKYSEEDAADAARAGRDAREWVDAFRRMGGRDLYFLTDVEDLKPFGARGVVPLRAPARPAEMAQFLAADPRAGEPGGQERLVSVQFPRAVVAGSAVVVGTQVQVDRAGTIAPTERPEVARAFAAVEGSEVQVVFVPNADTRRVLEELMPELPASVGGGPQLPTVSVEATDADAAEAGADSGTFTITRSDTSGDLTVYYSVSGTAINGTDYTQLSGAGVIPEGDYSVDVEVAPLDDGLEEGSETVILTISADAAYNVGSPDSGTVTLLDDDAVVVHNYAAGEETALGTVAGTYLDTHASDDVYEAITEQLRGKKSVLEHTWTFNVSGGNTATFHVEAWHEGTEDDFLFQYSTDGATWTDMVTVTKTGDDDTAQTYDFAGALSGTVYVRVIDTDRSPGNTALDTLSIDEMFIRCQ